MSLNKPNPYLFSTNERSILRSLRINNTPLKISKSTGIPRPTVYFTLERLELRGLVKRIQNKKKINWILTNKNVEEVSDQPTEYKKIKIYDTPELIVDFLHKFITKNTQRFKFFNGDHNVPYWNKYIDTPEIVKLNNSIRDNNLVSEVISSDLFLKENERILGKEWTESFVDKPTEYHLLNQKYTNFNSQILLRGEKIFLINMSKPIVIEIDDSEIHKCISSMFEFIKDHTKKLNLNEVVNKNTKY